jgi:hypothetical protein
VNNSGTGSVSILANSKVVNNPGVTISENTAGDAGGGLNHSGRASLALPRGTFTGNFTNNEGGGAWTGTERPVTIKDSVFSKNKAGVPETEDGVPEPGEELATRARTSLAAASTPRAVRLTSRD